MHLSGTMYVEDGHRFQPHAQSCSRPSGFASPLCAAHVPHVRPVDAQGFMSEIIVSTGNKIIAKVIEAYTQTDSHWVSMSTWDPMVAAVEEIAENT